MTLDFDKLLDETGWRLLQELQQNARLSYTELGQRVSLSSPAVAERIHKMEEAGIIMGYHAEVNPMKLGLSVLAIIHLEKIGGHSCSRVALEVMQISGVMECFRVTGNDSIIVKVIAASVDHLAKIIDQLSRYGVPATSIIRADSAKRYVISHEALSDEIGDKDN